MAEAQEKQQVELPPMLARRLKGVADKLEVEPGEALGRIIEKAEPASLQEKASEKAKVETVGPPRTRTWAKVAGPFAWFVLGIATLVFIGPFFAIVSIKGLEPNVRVDKLMTWGTHVLAAVVGFVGAVVTYFFGSSGGTNGSDS